MKKVSIRQRYLRLLDILRIPITTPYGFRWFPCPDENSLLLLSQKHEEADIQFVKKLLRPGDVFIDIGAHHGMYSLLAALEVKPSGRVISFEPSPRERERLARHVKLNRLSSIIHIEAYALSDEGGTTTLFLAPKFYSGLNSLRPINENISEISQVIVNKITLDEYVIQRGIEQIRLIKIDAEGGELSILQGSSYVIHKLRPVWLIEVADVRTAPWGYPARAILEYLQERGYRWYMAELEGIYPFSLETDIPLSRNFIALPIEKESEILKEITSSPS
ncbi:MAG: FkbM family methyltransferase [Bacteroidia bacterium]|nr:FkbM family methyltransferase [Bacteroidia bacterium]MDW8015415.1 FkbM family methyltransferase [Bacteroidia bacterium]